MASMFLESHCRTSKSSRRDSHLTLKKVKRVSLRVASNCLRCTVEVTLLQLLQVAKARKKSMLRLLLQRAKEKKRTKPMRLQLLRKRQEDRWRSKRLRKLVSKLKASFAESILTSCFGSRQKFRSSRFCALRIVLKTLQTLLL